MENIFFLLKNSAFLSGEIWEMPHSLWYNDSNGFLLGLILALITSFVICLIFFHVFPNLFNAPLTTLKWLLFMVINATAVFFITFLIAKNGIINYAETNDYLSSSPAMLSILKKGTFDMWMFGAQNAIYSLIMYFALTFICRLKSRGFNIPF